MLLGHDIGGVPVRDHGAVPVLALPCNPSTRALRTRSKANRFGTRAKLYALALRHTSARGRRVTV